MKKDQFQTLQKFRDSFRQCIINHCIVLQMKLEGIATETENKKHPQTDERPAVVLNNERSNRLNPDVILATTIDRTVILATVELSAQLGSEMKKYIARRGAETSG